MVPVREKQISARVPEDELLGMFDRAAEDLTDAHSAERERLVDAFARKD